MSTNGFVGFVIDGVDNAKYNHWDSYPSALGVEWLNWLREALVTFPEQELKDAARGIVWDDPAAGFSGPLWGCRCYSCPAWRRPLWGYLVNYDTREYEVYRNCRYDRRTQTGRFVNRSDWAEPFTLVVTFPFDSLPTPDAFLAAITEKEGR